MIYLGLGTLQRAIAVVLAPLYAHNLSTSDFGLLMLLLSVEALFSTVMDLGLSSGAVRSYFLLDRHRRNQFLAYAQFASLATAGVVTLLLAGATGVYLALSQQPSDLPLLLGLVLASALGQRVNGLAASFYRAQEDVRAFALLSGTRVLLVPAITAAAALVAPLTLVVILAIRIAVYLGTAAWELLNAWRRRDAGGDDALLRATLREALVRYGLPLLPHNLMRWGRAQGLRLLLGAALSLPALAIYGVAALPLQMLSLTGTASDQLFEPIYYRERTRATAAAAERLRAAAALILAGQAVLALAAMAIVPDAIRLLFPAAYRGAGLFAAMLLAGQYLTMIQAVWFKPLVFAGRTRALPLTTGVSTALGAVVTFLAARSGGVAGAALGYAVTAALGSALAILLVRRGGPDRTVPEAVALLLSGGVVVGGASPLAAMSVGLGDWWLALASLPFRLALYAALAALCAGPALFRYRRLLAEAVGLPTGRARTT